MAKKITKTNPNLVNLINELINKSHEEDAAIWKDIAKRLQKSNRRSAEVNLSNINRFANADETILVPGKVLSNGNLENKVNIAALKFSTKAQEKIEQAGGKCLSIAELVEDNPKGSNVRIME
ncbi:50S ribosomal protein L18e [Methanobrevibacter sp. DSM 116169]|uniref:50S ribosomal protein L18e n=1 Tax=Methanobrevibacter sp. DSM 116169 TaxID=3242727 RepID=UPI0038FC2E22